jgi:DNA-binding LacI/PurR family transcriptional regulator
MQIEYNPAMNSGYKYKRISESLRQKIKNGGYQEGSLLPTSKLLAKEYKTTPVTIDRAIGILAQEELVVRTPGVGTTVLKKMKGRTEVGKGKRELIGVLLQAQTDSRYWERLLEGVQDVLRPQGMVPIIAYHNQNSEIALEYVQMFSDQNVAVVLFAPFDRPDSVQYERDNAVIIAAMQGLGMQVIMIDRYLESIPGHFVSEYCYAHGLEMVETLIDKGFKKPLCFSTDYVSVIGAREKSVIDGYRKRGLTDIEKRITRISLKTYQENRYDPILQALETFNDIDVIICLNSRIFNTLIYTLAKYDSAKKFKNTKLAGFVDIELIDMEKVVAYVEQPVREMGKAAGRMVCALLTEDSPEYRHALVPCELRIL